MAKVSHLIRLIAAVMSGGLGLLATKNVTMTINEKKQCSPPNT